ncbi:MAG: hypothetical protein GX490_04495 [Bacilli bacterium]|nr:hypothetical protein [Bacilli bacterium]
MVYVYYGILFVCLYILIFFFPWYIILYTDGKLKCYLVMFGFIRVPISLSRIFSNFVSRKTDEDERKVHFMEIVENYKKYLSLRPIYQDLFRKATIQHLYWYTALPMDNPVLGLSFLPIVTTIQQYLLGSIYNQFKNVKDVDVDTKYNYMDDQIFIYFDCIIRLNLAKIISVSIKYIHKVPVLLKRSTMRGD